MKFARRDNRSALSAPRVILALAVAALAPILLHGSAPSWWSQRGVLIQEATADDYAPVNQGQLKNIARAAVAEMDAKLNGGAGDELHTLIASWSSSNPATNDFAPLNLGQVKNVAKPVYDRLIAAGLIDFYPWLSSATPSDDFAVANIGQVKNLFSFVIPRSNSLDDALSGRVAAGQRSGNLAVEANAVWFWGNRFGVESNFQSTYPKRLSTLSGITSVSAGDEHLVALAADGTILTWGKNSRGQLGNGTDVDRATPGVIPNMANVISVKASGAHNLALKRDGTVFGWGENYYGELGTGDNVSSNTPIQVVGLTDVRKIAAGPSRSVALKNDGTVWTWGYDHFDWQTGQEISSNFPSQVADLTDVIDVAAGYEHVIAVKADGTVWAWGLNYANQIGNDNPWWKFQDVPAQVPNLANVTKVASNFNHSLALLNDGTVWAWGYNSFGQLGDGTSQARQNPVQVAGLTDVVAIAVTYQYSLAMKADGTVWTWGDGSSGTLPGVDLRVPQQVGLGLFDPNHNGIDDRWEMEYLGGLNQPADGDADGDGISNRQEFFRGTDPRDYFNGATAVIEIVSGNNQLGDSGTLLPKPVTVRIKSATGQILSNAPIHFSVMSGGALVTARPGEPLQDDLVVRSDEAGEASAYVRLPLAPGIGARIAASPAVPVSAGTSAGVSLRVSSRFTPPSTPTPPPDPNTSPAPSATPKPSPTATPRPPYRYAIIDLGKDLYPLRINNKGWILMEGLDAEGNWGHYRWKGGVLERLANSELYQDTRVFDMNDAGTVVGRAGDEEGYRYVWADEADNEFLVGLKWETNTSVPVKVSGPSNPNWSEFMPGTMRLAYFSAIANPNAITNEADVYGGVYTGGAYSWFHPLGFQSIINAHLWNGSSAPVPLSFATSTRVRPPGYAFAVFDWQNPIDRVTRANSSRHYIGRRKTPTPGQYFGDSESGMVDGQQVPFDPVDINEAGIVAGSAGADMVVSFTPTSQTTITGASPLAINDHTRPAPSPQPSPAASPQPTPIPAPQILAWAGNAVVIWELQEDGRTWHPFGLEEMIPSMDGWQYLEPYDMNNTGAIVGRGWYTDPSIPGAQGESRAFLLVPVELMVDGNRDGLMSFDDEIIRSTDRTLPEKPYRFWLNNDHDEERTVDGADQEQDDYDAPPDFNNPAVPCARDLEDWSRLWINFKGLTELIKSPGVTVELAWKPSEGGNAWLASDGQPGVKVMLHDPQAGAGSGEATYLSDKSVASIQAHNIWGGVIKPVGLVAGHVLPQDFLQFVSDEKPYLHLLFEGWARGKGQLVVRVKKDGRKIGEYPPIDLHLDDVKNMYETYSVGDVREGNMSVLSPVDYTYWPNDRPTLMPLPSGEPLSPPPDETDSYVLWVHGWNMSPFDKASFADTAFKRLFWQGYKGRFGVFRWPTFFFSGDVPPAHHFDASEHRAWVSSLGLLSLLNDLNGGRFKGSIRMMAHSMGNVVASEALRRSNSGQVVHTFVASQAAISAHSYDVLAPVMQYDSGLGPTTPNVYGYYWRSAITSQPHEWATEGNPSYLHSDYLAGKAGRYFNYYNDADWALTWPRWQLDQQTKPDADYGYEYGGLGASRGFWRDRGFGATWLILPADRHEIFAWIAESRSYALGAQWVAGVVDRNIDMKRAPFDYGEAHKFHSAQFRGTNMERRHYWEKLLIDFDLRETQ